MAVGFLKKRLRWIMPLGAREGNSSDLRISQNSATAESKMAMAGHVADVRQPRSVMRLPLREAPIATDMEKGVLYGSTMALPGKRLRAEGKGAQRGTTGWGERTRRRPRSRRPRNPVRLLLGR